MDSQVSKITRYWYYSPHINLHYYNTKSTGSLETVMYRQTIATDQRIREGMAFAALLVIAEMPSMNRQTVATNQRIGFPKYSKLKSGTSTEM